MKRCVHCLNDHTVRHMSYDADGVCIYCRNYERIRTNLTDRKFLEERFRERIESVRGKYSYDAAIGISGGKDSVYVLHELVRKYGLHVKTFTLLNGFFSEQARKNVDRLVAEFGVEHEYISFPQELLQRFFRHSVKHWLTPCIACSYLGYAAMINYTVKINAGMCIHGRSPQQMLRYYGDDVFTPLIDAGLQSITELDLNALYSNLLSSIESRMNPQLLNDVKEILYHDIQGKQFREFVGYFLYHDYNEAEIVRFLRENTAWTPNEDYDHYDCAIHNAVHYIYQCAEGRPHCLPEISVLVRSGKCTIEEAIAMVERARLSQKPKDELKLLCNTIGLHQAPIFMKCGIYRELIRK